LPQPPSRDTVPLRLKNTLQIVARSPVTVFFAKLLTLLTDVKIDVDTILKG
jgi:hypothetical protein